MKLDLTGAQVPLAGGFIEGCGKYLGPCRMASMQVAHGGIEHLEAVAPAGAASSAESGLHQPLVIDQALSATSMVMTSQGAFLTFAKFAPADAQALEYALEPPPPRPNPGR